ncbi:hypothetical protein [Actinoplanes sp. DH11]|uniref:hypothetical protein n=1 Tax=Actinoplanes sp. DH11 TaxID=2857011 RepID=UPI001E2E13F8|nr:hypothetical protein [Actinoplanes sp. DH11]
MVIGRLGMADRGALAQESRAFHHRAGTLTPAVERNLARYAAGAPCVRVAHQPNFLASVNVVAQAAVCHDVNLRAGGGHAEVFFVVDYDTNDDRRYRHAALPSLLSRSGVHGLSAPATDVAGLTMFREPAPAPDFVAACVTALHGWAGQQVALLPDVRARRGLRHRLTRAVSSLTAILLAAADRAFSLADFNAIVLSATVNNVLGLPTLFLPGSRTFPVISEAIESIWQARAAIERASVTTGRQASGSGAGPLWIDCECGMRLPLTGDVRADRLHFACRRCEAAGTVDDTNVGEFAAKGVLIPRVTADDLLDGLVWGNAVGCDYRGGLPHYQQSARVARELGLPVLPMHLSARRASAPIAPLLGPQFAAALEDLAAGGGPNPAHDLVSAGRTSMVAALLWASDLDAGRLAADMEQVAPLSR